MSRQGVCVLIHYFNFWVLSIMALSGVRLETSGKEIGSFNHIKPRNSATDKRGTCLRPGPSLWHGKIRQTRVCANAGRTARRDVVFSHR